MGATESKLNSGEPRESESAAVQTEISRTRARMDGTISEIQDRLSFHRLAEDLGDLLTQGTGAGSRRVIEGIRKNPVPAGLVALGVVWLIVEKSRPKHSSHRAHDMSEPRDPHSPGPNNTDHPGTGVGEHIHAGLHKAGEVLHEAGQQVAAAAGVARNRIVGVGHHIRDAAVDAGRCATDLAHDAQHAASRAGQKVVNTYEENPLAVGAAAFAAGLIGGLLIPTTPAEDRLMGKASRELKDRARNLGQQAYAAGEDIATSVARAAQQGVSEGDNIADRLVHAAESAASAGAAAIGKQAKAVLSGDTPRNDRSDSSGRDQDRGRDRDQGQDRDRTQDRNPDDSRRMAGRQSEPTDS